MQGLISQGIKHMDPHKQAQIQQMMDQYDQKSTTSSTVSFNNTGKSGNVLGAQCQIFAIIDQGQHKSDVCLASYQQLELPQSDVASFNKLKSLIQQFKQTSPGQQDMFTIMASGLENLNGVPLKMVNYYPDGKIKNMVQAGSISFRKIPEVAYQIPQAYQQNLTPLM